MTAEDYTWGHIKYYLITLFIGLVMIYAGATSLNGFTGIKEPTIPVIVFGGIVCGLALLGICRFSVYKFD